MEFEVLVKEKPAPKGGGGLDEPIKPTKSASQEKSSISSSPSLSAKDLQPGYQIGQGRFRARQGSRHLRMGKSFGHAGKGMLAELKDHDFYRKLYEKVETLLSYPSEAGRREQSGFVQVRLPLNERSHCLKSEIIIEGGYPLLKRHIRHLIEKVCKEQIFGKTHGKDLIVDMNFEFDLLETHDETKKKFRKGTIENNLFFYRSFKKLQMQRKGDRYFVPLLNLVN